ncbi:MAG: acyl transferase [Leptolyngbyaceae cyanobacterium bins.59]|nr:acyl transferase [Leptolyngbyaceae cyanobacterium bins.59]
MTLLSLILSWFPTLVLLLVGSSLFYLCYAPGLLSLGLLFFSLYGFPLLIYQLHNFFFPVKEGMSYLLGKEYSPWWGSHQIQAIYIAFPALETALRLIPGVFSLWLRLWGSKIGQSVYWTPDISISDRNLLEIGDRVVMGYRVGIYTHVIKPRRNNLMLYVKKVKIGSHAFVGAGSRLAPGSVVQEGAYLPILTDIYPNQQI